jgi:hypothetical protein
MSSRSSSASSSVPLEALTPQELKLLQQRLQQARKAAVDKLNTLQVSGTRANHCHLRFWRGVFCLQQEEMRLLQQITLSERSESTGNAGSGPPRSASV